MTPEQIQAAEDDAPSCGQPCHPDRACDECAPYWERMQAEGLWDKRRGRWTDKGWADILRSARYS